MEFLGSPMVHFMFTLLLVILFPLSCKGYSVISEIVKPDSNCQHIVNIYISGKAQEIQEVVVRPIKSLAQIREERSTLAMRETRMVTGIEVLQSPITALYQAFSKKERSKRNCCRMGAF